MKLREIIPYCDLELNIDFKDNNKEFWDHDWRNKEFKPLLEAIPEEFLDCEIVKIQGWDDGLTIVIEK